MRGAIFVGVGLFCGFAVVRVVPSVLGSDFLPIHNVVVEGASDARVPEITSFAQVGDGTPLFAVNVDEVRQRVEEHPFVRAAAVRRVPPDTLEIRVVERQAIAVLVAPEPYLLDETGVPFMRAHGQDAVELPVITGVTSEELGTPLGLERIDLAYDVLRAHRDGGAPGGALHEVHLDEVGARVVLDGGLVVEVGKARLPERMRRLGDVLERLRAHGQVPSRIFLNDARRPERVAVRLRLSAEVPGVSGG